MQLKILKTGRYNNALHQADDYTEGDTLETSAAYGVLLVADGFAEEIPPEPVEEEVADTKKSAKKAIAVKAGRTANPFVPQG